jgi:RNA polymerase sigma-70 factor (ECF subfamily)
VGSQETDKQETTLDVSQWVHEHADVLYRYALQRVRRRDVAEEVVQETFLSALRARKDFAGQSSERTWLIGILRHKIVDHFRQVAQTKSHNGHAEREVPAEAFFKSDGHWRDMPADWKWDPVTILDRRDFWRVFEKCFSALPRKLRDAFVLRAMDEQEPAAVCDNLGISESNLWVRLHRARLSLKDCLENNWFRKHSK